MVVWEISRRKNKQGKNERYFFIARRPRQQQPPHAAVVVRGHNWTSVQAQSDPAPAYPSPPKIAFLNRKKVIFGEIHGPLGVYCPKKGNFGLGRIGGCGIAS
jgi:hypothetical protein